MTDEELEQTLRDRMDAAKDDAVNMAISDYGLDQLVSFIQYCAESEVDNFLDVVIAQLPDQPKEDDLPTTGDLAAKYEEYFLNQIENDYLIDDLDEYVDVDDLTDTLTSTLESLDPVEVSSWLDEDNPDQNAELDDTACEEAAAQAIDDSLSMDDISGINQMIKDVKSEDIDKALEMVFGGDYADAADRLLAL